MSLALGDDCKIANYDSSKGYPYNLRLANTTLLCLFWQLDVHCVSKFQLICFFSSSVFPILNISTSFLFSYKCVWKATIKFLQLHRLMRISYLMIKIYVRTIQVYIEYFQRLCYGINVFFSYICVSRAMMRLYENKIYADIVDLHNSYNFRLRRTIFAHLQNNVERNYIFFLHHHKH